MRSILVEVAGAVASVDIVALRLSEYLGSSARMSMDLIEFRMIADTTYIYQNHYSRHESKGRVVHRITMES